MSPTLRPDWKLQKYIWSRKNYFRSSTKNENMSKQILLKLEHWTRYIIKQFSNFQSQIQRHINAKLNTKTNTKTNVHGKQHCAPVCLRQRCPSRLPCDSPQWSWSPDPGKYYHHNLLLSPAPPQTGKHPWNHNHYDPQQDPHNVDQHHQQSGRGWWEDW